MAKFAAVVIDTGGNLPPVSLIPVVHLDLRISSRIFEKIRNDPNVILGSWGKVIHEKNLKQNSRDTAPLSLPAAHMKTEREATC